MKFLSFIFALMVLLQSTVAEACIPQMGAEPTCCTHESIPDCDAKDDLDAGHNHESRKCSSGCNPFQYCGCCSDAKQAGMISMPLSFVAFLVVAERQYTFNDSLPEMITYEFRQPPKVKS